MALYHEQAGEGDTVVLLHSAAGDSRMWDGQWPAFTAAYRTVRCDLRGWGRSPIGPGRFSNAGDVLALLAELGIERTALVGVSFGGRVALELALARPELVSALVLVGPGLPDHEWSATVQGFGVEEEAALERGDVEAAVEANLRLWVDGPSRRPEDVHPAARQLVAEMLRQAVRNWLPVLETAEEELLVPDLVGRLGEIRAPTLVVVGEEDVDDIQVIADRLVREIGGARRASIPNAAHTPQLERPAEFNDLVLGFLAGLV